MAAANPLVEPDLGVEEAASPAVLVKALADPTRLRIVDAIRTVAPEAACQCELGGHPLHQPLGWSTMRPPSC